MRGNTADISWPKHVLSSSRLIWESDNEQNRELRVSIRQSDPRLSNGSKHTTGRLYVIFEIHPLAVGAYERNATVTAQGAETGRPGEQTVTRIHNEEFEADGTEVYPSVELKVSFERDVQLLQKIMEAVLHAHQYEEPIIHVREEWASRANYTPKNDNPNRWWNDGRGTPEMVPLDQSSR